jgi:hypothetical protein
MLRVGCFRTGTASTTRGSGGICSLIRLDLKAVTIVVSNTSSIASATHPPVIGYTKWWNNNVGVPLNSAFNSGPLSKTTQTFVLHESLAACTCKK